MCYFAPTVWTDLEQRHILSTRKPRLRREACGNNSVPNSLAGGARDAEAQPQILQARPQLVQPTRNLFYPTRAQKQHLGSQGVRDLTVAAPTVRESEWHWHWSRKNRVPRLVVTGYGLQALIVDPLLSEALGFWPLPSGLLCRGLAPQDPQRATRESKCNL